MNTTKALLDEAAELVSHEPVDQSYEQGVVDTLTVALGLDRGDRTAVRAMLDARRDVASDRPAPVPPVITDPARIGLISHDEVAFRRAAPREVGEFSIVSIEGFSPRRPGYYACGYVVTMSAERPGTFSSHVLVFEHDRGRPGAPRATWGVTEGEYDAPDYRTARRATIERAEAAGALDTSAVLITRAQAERWAGRHYVDGQWDRVREAVANSSVRAAFLAVDMQVDPQD